MAKSKGKNTVHRSLFIYLISLCTLPTFADSMNCQVVGVTDGNTIRCLNGQNKILTVKLKHIEAPKINQPFGIWAKQDLFRMVLKKYITVEFDNKETFYRDNKAIIYLGCKDINQEMIKNGMAWVARDDKNKPLYTQAEKEARQKKVGLWSQPAPIPPWQWEAK